MNPRTWALAAGALVLVIALVVVLQNVGPEQPVSSPGEGPTDGVADVTSGGDDAPTDAATGPAAGAEDDESERGPRPDGGPPPGKGKGTGTKPEVWVGERLQVSSGPLNDSPMSKAFTCEGAGINPPFGIQNVPEGTAELALLFHDPDAQGGPFLHWQVSGIDPAGGYYDADGVPGGGTEGMNGSGEVGYTPPCPPPGELHRYVFTVYALSRPVAPLDTADVAKVQAAFEQAALAEATISTTYEMGGAERAED